MIQVFDLEPTPTYPGKYLIKMKPDLFFVKSAKGSLNVLEARILGLSYASYCRMCRDCFGAELHGQNCLYIVPVFEDNVLSRKLVRLLNTYATSILWERAHPDWKAHMKENENNN